MSHSVRPGAPLVERKTACPRWLSPSCLIHVSLLLILATGCRSGLNTPPQAHLHSVQAVAYSPDGRFLASGGADHIVRLWSTATEREVFRFEGHTNDVRCVVFSPDSELLASGDGDGTIRFWKVKDREPWHELTLHTKAVEALAFSPNGKRLASGSRDGSLRLWGVEGGGPLRQLDGQTDVLAVSFSSNGEQLAYAGADQKIRIWNIPGRVEINTFAGHDGIVHTLAFSPEGCPLGNVLVSGGDDGAVRVWEVANGAELFCLKPNNEKGDQDPVRSLVFSSDGKMVYCAGKNKTVYAWDLVQRAEVRQFKGRHEAMQVAAVSPDGKSLATGHRDGTLYLWNVASVQPRKNLEMGNAWNPFDLGVPPPKLDYTLGAAIIGAICGVILVLLLHPSAKKRSESRWLRYYKTWHFPVIVLRSSLRGSFLWLLLVGLAICVSASVCAALGWFVGFGISGKMEVGAVGLAVGLVLGVVIPALIIGSNKVNFEKFSDDLTSPSSKVLCCLCTGCYTALLSTFGLSLFTQGDYNSVALAIIVILFGWFILRVLNSEKNGGKVNWMVIVGFELIVSFVLITPAIKILEDVKFGAMILDHSTEVFGGQWGLKAVFAFVCVCWVQLLTPIMNRETT